MADEDSNPAQNSENEKDFNKMIDQESSPGTTKGGKATDRDLGTVGGGTIPSAGPGTSSIGVNTSGGTANASGATGKDAAEAGSPRDGGTTASRDQTTNAGNTIDRNAQGNLGGRNPSQPQTAMGDRDADIRRGHSSSTSPVQPTTSRDPSDRGKDQDTEKGS